MKCFMITVALPGTFTPEFTSLIPPQRAYINKLMGRGVVSTYTLSRQNKVVDYYVWRRYGRN